MNGWTLTKVWQVDHKLVVADTINEAVELFKAYMGKDYHDEPDEVRCIGAEDTAPCDHDALIAEQGVIVEGQLIEDVEEGQGDYLLSAEYIPRNSGSWNNMEEVIVNIRKK